MKWMQALRIKMLQRNDTTMSCHIVKQDEFDWLLLLLPLLLDSSRLPFSLALKLRTLFTANCNHVTKFMHNLFAGQ